MKDLGEKLNINADFNQKHKKDHTKELKSKTDSSPKTIAKFKKVKRKLKNKKDK